MLISNPHFLITILLALLVAACSVSKEASEENGEPEDSYTRAGESYEAVDLDLVTGAANVRSVQLHKTGQEVSLPFIRKDSGESLTLKFDLLSDQARPLSVFFYHADRHWRRDLLPSQYLAGFQRADLHNYSTSRATELRYVHYQFQFPNSGTRFLVSGNYILRVTEQGREDEVLFERTFFITEDAADVRMDLQNVIRGGLGWPLRQPVARFRPPSDFAGDFFDFNVCFARNARFDLARCGARPSLMELPYLRFYLPAEASFEMGDELRVLDLRRLSTTHQIVSLSLEVSPYEIVLDIDRPGVVSNPGGTFLGGQPAISTEVRDVSDPDLMAEYVSVRFRYAPPDYEELPGSVLLTGSFNMWQLDPDYSMEWSDEEGFYEADVVLKQGLYEYQYHVVDYSLDPPGRGQVSLSESLYTTLVYYYDHRVNTDRLVALHNVVAR